MAAVALAYCPGQYCQESPHHCVAHNLSFAGLAIVALITSIISQVVLIQHPAVFQLRMRLSRQISSEQVI